VKRARGDEEAASKPEPKPKLARTANVVPREWSGARLDRFLAGVLSVSRSELQRWIAAGCVTVDGKPREASARVREGECVEVEPMAAEPSRARADAGVAVDVMYLDDDVVVVRKPAGLVVHPARGHAGGTLVNGLLALGVFGAAADAADAVGAGGAPDAVTEDTAGERPGIVHRLDKGTSGVMVVARTAEAREGLKRQFAEHSIERAYDAIVVGEARGGTFDTLHGRHPRDRLRFTTRVRSGKRAVTHVRVVARLEGATRVECTLETGRTHQIRVHLAESGTPVLGDPLYGRPPREGLLRDLAERLGHQALHARVLGFDHPRSGRRMRFEAALPDDFEEALRVLSPASSSR
jgi:23S rRNA pseudouridine1911/1915/1917 synthase